jgi:transposase
MRPPIRVRRPTDEEQQTLEAGLRSADATVLRRSQIILASARGDWVPRIARHVGCGEQTVRNVIHAFNDRGAAALPPGSRRAKTIYRSFAPGQAEQLRALLHQSPRTFGKPTSLWTLDLAAEVSFAQGLTSNRVSDETIRMTLRRLGVRWTRAKQWITSPDPQYARKKVPATA